MYVTILNVREIFILFFGPCNVNVCENVREIIIIYYLCENVREIITVSFIICVRIYPIICSLYPIIYYLYENLPHHICSLYPC